VLPSDHYFQPHFVFIHTFTRKKELSGTVYWVLDDFFFFPKFNYGRCGRRYIIFVGLLSSSVVDQQPLWLIIIDFLPSLTHICITIFIQEGRWWLLARDNNQPLEIISHWGRYSTNEDDNQRNQPMRMVINHWRMMIGRHRWYIVCSRWIYIICGKWIFEKYHLAPYFLSRTISIIDWKPGIPVFGIPAVFLVL
jgi:hypothetical protein